MAWGIVRVISFCLANRCRRFESRHVHLPFGIFPFVLFGVFWFLCQQPFTHFITMQNLRHSFLGSVEDNDDTTEHLFRNKTTLNGYVSSANSVYDFSRISLFSSSVVLVYSVSLERWNESARYKTRVCWHERKRKLKDAGEYQICEQEALINFTLSSGNLVPLDSEGTYPRENQPQLFRIYERLTQRVFS